MMNFSPRQLSSIFLLALLITFAGCSKDEILDPQPETPKTTSLFAERIVDVTENYDYYGEKFSVTYTFDQETEKVLAVSGDVDRARELFTSKSGFPKGSIVTVGNMDEDASTKIRLFDTQEEADVLTNLKEKSCDYWEMPSGNSVFRFYEHNNYVGELQDLTKPNRWIVRWNNVMPHNNDKISSIAADGNPIHVSIDSRGRAPIVALYENICFGGHTITLEADGTGVDYYWDAGDGYPVRYYFRLRVPNLSTISLYLGYWQGWTNWNDRTSSLRWRWYP